MTDQEELRRQEYMGRINRVMDYIHGNLTGDLRLETLARVARFSPFHFHRVFKGVVGETLNGFIRRVRVSTAASRLLSNPKLSITQIAVQCGYSSPSAFAREFRGAFGMSASQFRRGGHEGWRKMRQAEGKPHQAESRNGRDPAASPSYTLPISVPRGTDVNFSVEVKQMPEWNVVYVRHIGPYREIGKAFGRLFRWAGPRGLVQFPETKSLAVYHDSPEVTDPSKLRSDACLTAPVGTKVDGELGTMKIPGGLFAVAHVEIHENQFAEAWDKLLSEWMPKSGYQPDDRLCYEMYLNDPDTHPQKTWIVDICEPVGPCRRLPHHTELDLLARAGRGPSEPTDSPSASRLAGVSEVVAEASKKGKAHRGASLASDKRGGPEQALSGCPRDGRMEPHLP